METIDKNCDFVYRERMENGMPKEGNYRVKQLCSIERNVKKNVNVNDRFNV